MRMGHVKCIPLYKGGAIMAHPVNFYRMSQYAIRDIAYRSLQHQMGKLKRGGELHPTIVLYEDRRCSAKCFATA
jgi:hypothetical protein